MAKGKNANSDLYKRLHEEYGLEVNVDFYLHPQSGSYIIKHNAVKKLVAKQRDKGFIIETPSGKDVIIINDGTREGIHGKEVVVAGDFYLKNKDGVLIEKVYRTGEVNQKNCKNFYPHAMAEKRLYDRGVLDLLRFAQEGLYSDVEADEFKNSPKQRTPPQKPQPTKEVIASQPLPSVSTPKITAPEKKVVPVVHESNVEFEIINILTENTEGTSKSELWNMIPSEKEKIDAAIDKLMEEKRISKTGERRGTKYHVFSEESKESEETEPLTKGEYNVLWRGASEDLRSKGLDYKQIMGIVDQVTGHSSAISAFNAGALTKDHIAQISKLGAQSNA